MEESDGLRLLAAFSKECAEHESWRGADCWDRDEQGLQDVLRRHCLNRWRFDIGTLPDADQRIVAAALDPYSPENPAEWRPKNRIAAAVKVLAILIGLTELLARCLPGSERHEWLADKIEAVRSAGEPWFLPVKFRRKLEAIGLDWLGRQDEM